MLLLTIITQHSIMNSLAVPCIVAQAIVGELRFPRYDVGMRNVERAELVVALG